MFAVRQVCKKLPANRKDVLWAFMNLENALCVADANAMATLAERPFVVNPAFVKCDRHLLNIDQTQGRLTINNRYKHREFKLKFSALLKDYDLKYAENCKKKNLLKHATDLIYRSICRNSYF